MPEVYENSALQFFRTTKDLYSKDTLQQRDFDLNLKEWVLKKS